MPTISPAMAARRALAIPPEFDIRRSYIQIFANWGTGEYVKTVHPADQYEGLDSLPQYYRAAEEQAKSLWKLKYEVEMPDDVEGQWAETTFASAIPHDGPTNLSPEERAVVARADEFGDFTLDMLWLMVEGLGWRLGKAVPENDLGWLVIWAENEECGCYIDIIRDVLGMPEIPAQTYLGWRPPAVIAAYQIPQSLNT